MVGLKKYHQQCKAWNDVKAVGGLELVLNCASLFNLTKFWWNCLFREQIGKTLKKWRKSPRKTFGITAFWYLNRVKGFKFKQKSKFHEKLDTEFSSVPEVLKRLQEWPSRSNSWTPINNRCSKKSENLLKIFAAISTFWSV